MLFSSQEERRESVEDKRPKTLLFSLYPQKLLELIVGHWITRILRHLVSIRRHFSLCEMLRVTSNCPLLLFLYFSVERIRLTGGTKAMDACGRNLINHTTSLSVYWISFPSYPVSWQTFSGGKKAHYLPKYDPSFLLFEVVTAVHNTLHCTLFLLLWVK